jgi:hypothetical protein
MSPFIRFSGLTLILTLKRPRKKLYSLSDPLKGAPAMGINIAASVVATKHTAIVETILRTLREAITTSIAE